MTISIDEAIKETNKRICSVPPDEQTLLEKAKLLSIQALIEVKRLRSNKYLHVLERLPGETEE
jgi:hypothetical protein